MSKSRTASGTDPSPGVSSAGTANGHDPSRDPDMIRVFDEYGREMFLTKQQWKATLLGNLDKARNDPDQLYALLVGALEDGFGADIVSYAEQLHRTDPVFARGATILVHPEGSRPTQGGQTKVCVTGAS